MHSIFALCMRFDALTIQYTVSEVRLLFTVTPRIRQRRQRAARAECAGATSASCWFGGFERACVAVESRPSRPSCTNGSQVQVDSGGTPSERHEGNYIAYSCLIAGKS